MFYVILFVLGQKRSLVYLLEDRDDGDAEIPEQDPPNSAEKVKKEIDFLEAIYPVIPKDEEILQWWRIHASELPLLALVVKKLYSGCATSVTSERIFSLSGNIVSKKRSSLRPELINMLVFLAFN